MTELEKNLARIGHTKESAMRSTMSLLERIAAAKEQYGASNAKEWRDGVERDKRRFGIK